MLPYELTYIVTDIIEDPAAQAVMSEVNKELERNGGVIIKEEGWGKRHLAYPIKHRNHGTYVTVQIHLEPQTIAEIDRFLRLHESVLRHLLITFVQPTIKTTDEAELTEALDKRVEDKKTKAKDEAKEPTVAIAESTLLKEDATVEEEPKVRTRKAVSKSAEEEKKVENDEERRKAVDEKLSQLLGDEKK